MAESLEPDDKGPDQLLQEVTKLMQLYERIIVIVPPDHVDAQRPIIQRIQSLLKNAPNSGAKFISSLQGMLLDLRKKFGEAKHVGTVGHPTDHKNSLTEEEKYKAMEEEFMEGLDTLIRTAFPRQPQVNAGVAAKIEEQIGRGRENVAAAINTANAIREKADRALPKFFLTLLEPGYSKEKLSEQVEASMRYLANLGISQDELRPIIEKQLEIPPEWEGDRDMLAAILDRVLFQMVVCSTEYYVNDPGELKALVERIMEELEKIPSLQSHTSNEDGEGEEGGNFDVPKAEQILRECLQWREEHPAEPLTDENVQRLLSCKPEWLVPAKKQKFAAVINYVRGHSTDHWVRDSERLRNRADGLVWMIHRLESEEGDEISLPPEPPTPPEGGGTESDKEKKKVPVGRVGSMRGLLGRLPGYLPKWGSGKKKKAGNSGTSDAKDSSRLPKPSKFKVVSHPADNLLVEADENIQFVFPDNASAQLLKIGNSIRSAASDYVFSSPRWPSKEMLRQYLENRFRLRGIEKDVSRLFDEQLQPFFIRKILTPSAERLIFAHPTMVDDPNDLRIHLRAAHGIDADARMLSAFTSLCRRALQKANLNRDHRIEPYLQPWLAKIQSRPTTPIHELVAAFFEQRGVVIPSDEKPMVEEFLRKEANKQVTVSLLERHKQLHGISKVSNNATSTFAKSPFASFVLGDAKPQKPAETVAPAPEPKKEPEKAAEKDEKKKK